MHLWLFLLVILSKPVSQFSSGSLPFQGAFPAPCGTSEHCPTLTYRTSVFPSGLGHAL